MTTLRRYRTRLVSRLARLHRRLSAAGDAGMTTAEYAVGTVAAVAFAVVLYKIVHSSAVADRLTSIIDGALSAV